MDEVGLGIIGLGNVGSGTLAILADNAEQIALKLGFRLKVAAVCSRTAHAKNLPPALGPVFRTTDWREVVAHPEVQIVAELVGGTTVAAEIFDAAQKEAASVREQIQKGRSALAAAYLSKHGQPEIDQLLATQGTVEAQMAGIELRAFAKLVDTLTPDQQKKVGPVFQQMAGMFSGRDWNRIGR